MEFDEIVVKESPGLCRCCLSEGCYKDLGTEYTWMNENEVYADMLLECFDISISQHNEGPNGPNRLICEVCITRLRDACNFKKQVLDSEKKFVDMVGRGEFRPKVLIYQAQMKSEVNEDTAGEDAEVEYLEEMDFGDDDEPLKVEASASEIAVEALPVTRRGRPRKALKTEKKKSKLSERPKTSKALASKGAPSSEAASKSSHIMTSTKRNRLMKRNAVIILENSTAIPFKWHRQNYLCFFCHKAFKDTDLLKDHTKTEHKTSSIESGVSYIRGDEKVKIDVTTLNCTICNDKLLNLDKLIEHLKVSHKKIFHEKFGYGLVPYRLNESLSCAICNLEFQYFIKLNHHMNEHFGSYVCETCGKSFLSQDRLRCHSLRHSSSYRCNICSETFESLAQKTSHEAKTHDKVLAVKCNYCPENFTSYLARRVHHNVVHNIAMQEYNCPVCGKNFKIISKMKVHLNQVHIREKNFSCTMCDQKFFSKTHLKNHMIKHVGERIHQCEICMKSYARKQTLRDHMRIHNKGKKFSCSLCSQEFVQNNSLRLHMRMHHPVNESA